MCSIWTREKGTARVTGLIPARKNSNPPIAPQPEYGGLHPIRILPHYAALHTAQLRKCLSRPNDLGELAVRVGKSQQSPNRTNPEQRQRSGLLSETDLTWRALFALNLPKERVAVLRGPGISDNRQQQIGWRH